MSTICPTIVESEKKYAIRQALEINIENKIEKLSNLKNEIIKTEKNLN